MALDEALGNRERVRSILFGEFKIFSANGREIIISNRRARAILAMLCIVPGEPIDREQISKLLWPGRFRAQARASLRQCLHDLNRQLQAEGCDVLELGSSRITINPALIDSDLQELEAALANGDDAQATRILTEIAGRPLLEHIDFGQPFGDWLAAKRLHVESQLRLATQRLLDALSGREEIPAYDRLAAAWAGREALPGRRTRIGIAVLPFEQHDELGESLFLAEGVVDELHTRLGTIAELSLAGRTSINAMMSQGGTLPELAGKLGVSHLVEGTVLRTPDYTSVTIRLIDGESGREIWSERLQDTVDGFVGSRQVFGGQVIGSLCRALGVESAPSPHRRMTVDREAYALYLQGRSLVQRSMTEGAVATAIELLERSLAIDPDFAECWTALAEAHVHTAVYTPCLERVQRSEQAARCADKAISLDPGQGHALAMRGIHEWTLGNPAKALDFALEAYRLEPNNADVTVRLGSFLLYLGRTREALPFVEAAVELDPVYGRNYAMLCTAHFNLGNMDAALAAGQRMVDLGMPGMWLAIVQSAIGEHEKAFETYYRTRLLMNSVILPPAGTAPMSDEARDAYWRLAAKGICSGKDEDRVLYCQMLAGLHATMPDPYDPTLAFPAIWMGYAPLAMKIYRERIHPANMFGLMSLWADVEPIRQTRLQPDFMQFAEDIGLVEAWNRHGWPDLMPADPRKN
jgi:TolB-like protein